MCGGGAGGFRDGGLGHTGVSRAYGSISFRSFVRIIFPYSLLDQ